MFSHRLRGLTEVRTTVLARHGATQPCTSVPCLNHQASADRLRKGTRSRRGLVRLAQQLAEVASQGTLKMGVDARAALANKPRAQLFHRSALRSQLERSLDCPRHSAILGCEGFGIQSQASNAFRGHSPVRFASDPNQASTSWIRFGHRHCEHSRRLAAPDRRRTAASPSATWTRRARGLARAAGSHEQAERLSRSPPR
jgi:hypothetical protein